MHTLPNAKDNVYVVRVKHCLEGLYKFEFLWELKRVRTWEAPKESLILHKAFWKKNTYPLCKQENGIIGLHFVNPCLHFEIKQWILVAHLETKVKVWVVYSILFIFEQQSYNKIFFNYVLIYKSNFPNWWFIENNILILVNWNYWKI